MKKVITLSETEYNNLIAKRENLKEEVRMEYNSEVRTPAIMGALSLLLISVWGYKAILNGYDTFPKLTLITIIFVSIFHILSVGAAYSILKNRLK